MNIFETVKEMVSTREAASYYGIRVNHNGMACCPFHNDKTPSMKIDKRYYCFGCQETGDVIDFVGKLYGLNALESAKRIASDLGIAIPDYHVKTMNDFSKPVVKSEEQRKRELQKVFENWVKKTTDLLLDYNLLLQEWELLYKPENADSFWHARFCEALMNKSKIDFFIDQLLFGKLDEQIQFCKVYKKEIEKIEERMDKYRLECNGEPGKGTDDRGTGIRTFRENRER